MKKIFLSIIALIFFAGISTIDAQNNVYSGSIGSYKIHMVLNNRLEGYYYYEKNPNSHFKLLVSREDECSEEESYAQGGAPMDVCVKVSLQEYAPGSGKNSGEFIGIFSSRYHYGYLTSNFSGTFRNKSNGNTYYFEVSSSEKIE